MKVVDWKKKRELVNSIFTIDLKMNGSHTYFNVLILHMLYVTKLLLMFIFMLDVLFMFKSYESCYIAFM